MGYLGLLPTGLENWNQSSQQGNCGKSMRTVASWKKARINQYFPQPVKIGKKMCEADTVQLEEDRGL